MSLGNVWTLARYWSKGRFSRTTLIAMILGETAFSAFLLFAGGTFLSFSARFGQSGGAQITEASWGLVLGIYLIGLVQSGFSGAGLPFVSADVDYVFTAPVKTTDVFTAKILLNSVAVFLAFPPIFFLYFRAALFYGTSPISAVVAGLVTLVFFFMGLMFSADITLAQRTDSGRRTTIVRYLLTGLILAASLIPLLALIPGAQSSTLLDIIRLLPSGIVAEITVGLVGSLGVSLGGYLIEFTLLLAWLAAFSIIGARMSRRQFYELLQVTNPNQTDTLNGKNVISKLNPDGKSLWSVVRTKERLLMSRTKEARGLLFSSLILSVFLVIYSLAGTFTSSPTSFLLILFIIGSFGSGNAMSWIEKERLWILKTSSISLRSYVKNVFLARVTPLLIFLAPAIAVVGVLLIPANLGTPETLLGIVLALIGAVEIASITMGGSMYFAARYQQSSSDDILAIQAQNLTNIKRLIYQTAFNLMMVGPLMLLVLAAGWLLALFGVGTLLQLGFVLAIGGLSYSLIMLNFVLNKAGDSIRKREDL